MTLEYIEKIDKLIRDMKESGIDIEAKISGGYSKIKNKLQIDLDSLDQPAYRFSLQSKFVGQAFNLAEKNGFKVYWACDDKKGITGIILYPENFGAEEFSLYPPTINVSTVKKESVATDEMIKMANSPSLKLFLGYLRANVHTKNDITGIYGNRSEALKSGDNLLVYVEKMVIGLNERCCCVAHYRDCAPPIMQASAIGMYVDEHFLQTPGVVENGGVPFVPAEYVEEYKKYMAEASQPICRNKC